MTNISSLIVRVFAVSTLLLALQAPAADSVLSILGQWNVVAATVAPWVSAEDAKRVDQGELKGKTILFADKSIKSDSVLGCGNVNYEPVDYPADELFQGGLVDDAEAAARKLGFKRFPVNSVSVNCDSGIFEYHFLDNNTILVALNNVIWTLKRSH